MDYVEVRFYNNPVLNDAIIAWLGENDFDMFEERSDGLNAYVRADLFPTVNLDEILSAIPDAKKNIRYESSLIRDQNWNTKWESNFEPVQIDNKVYIRAPFHEPAVNYETEIIIEPKMSFGTGHHATTSLMVSLMLDLDFKSKTVLDMGCGTCVLAIFAEKKGASEVLAIDIDEWAFTNSRENCIKNSTSRITVLQGNVHSVPNRTFDIILANINRNVLLEDIPLYAGFLNPGGHLLLSGILAEDKTSITSRCKEHGLDVISDITKDNWLAIHLKKNYESQSFINGLSYSCFHPGE